MFSKKVWLMIAGACLLCILWHMYNKSTSTTETLVPDDTGVPKTGLYEINNDEFKDAMKKLNKGVVVFYAPWCGHCKALKESGELEKLSNNVHVLTYNGDEHDVSNMKDYGIEIQGFPTICKIDNGKLVELNQLQERTADSIMSHL